MPPRDDLVVRGAVVTAHDEDGSADAGLAKLDRLLEERDTEAVDLRPLERARDRGRAVAVRVGLEHRPDAGPARVLADHAQIVAERFEVHLGAGRPHGVCRRGAAGAEDAGHVGSDHRRKERPVATSDSDR